MTHRTKTLSHRPRAGQYYDVDKPERWLVSYADFITLLLAFFIVMYAASSINEGKYQTLSTVLDTAFGGPSNNRLASLEQPSVLEPINEISDQLPLSRLAKTSPLFSGNIALNNPEKTNSGRSGESPASATPASATPASATPESSVPPEEPIKPPAESTDVLVEHILRKLQDLIEPELVSVRRTGTSVEMEIRERVLFASGSIDLNDRALDTARRIAELLATIDNPIQVEGHTDNKPIDSTLYPSNWELSAARAASVIHLLIEAGLSPSRLSAVGHGEFKPIADNTTEEGRIRNRRVVLVIEDNFNTASGENDDQS